MTNLGDKNPNTPIKNLSNDKEDKNSNITEDVKKGNDLLGNDVSFMESQSNSLPDSTSNKTENPPINSKILIKQIEFR